MIDVPKLLFVCSRNKKRSATAESMYARSSSVEVRGRGTASSAARKISEADVSWADRIFVMESEHAKILRDRFDANLTITVLGIPDEYEFRDAELEQMIEATVNAYLDLD